MAQINLEVDEIVKIGFVKKQMERRKLRVLNSDSEYSPASGSTITN
jgi:hypothetical protein